MINSEENDNDEEVSQQLFLNAKIMENPVIIRRIFQYLSMKDLLSCGMVSLLWRDISNNVRRDKDRCFSHSWVWLEKENHDNDDDTDNYFNTFNHSKVG